MGKLGKFLSGARKVLGKLTDLLLVGRNRGWWDKDHGSGFERKDYGPPK